jgi:hypothetical protein
VKEQLLAGGEDKILPAIHAPEYLVLEFHDPVACRRIAWPAAPALLENRTNLPGPGHRSGLQQLQKLWGRRVGEGEWSHASAIVPPLSAVDTEGPRLSYAICGPGGLFYVSPALYAPSSGYVFAPVLP